MTPQQLDRISDHLLEEWGTRGLRGWLAARGQVMSLLELDDERRCRGVRPGF